MSYGPVVLDAAKVTTTAFDSYMVQTFIGDETRGLAAEYKSGVGGTEIGGAYPPLCPLQANSSLTPRNPSPASTPNPPHCSKRRPTEWRPKSRRRLRQTSR